jgi:hypothetical protein
MMEVEKICLAVIRVVEVAKPIRLTLDDFALFRTFEMDVGTFVA